MQCYWENSGNYIIISSALFKWQFQLTLLCDFPILFSLLGMLFFLLLIVNNCLFFFFFWELSIWPSSLYLGKLPVSKSRWEEKPSSQYKSWKFQGGELKTAADWFVNLYIFETEFFLPPTFFFFFFWVCAILWLDLTHRMGKSGAVYLFRVSIKISETSDFAA